MGFCLYGHEIDDTTSPIDAGLGWITKPAEGKNLIDGELYIRQRAEGTERKLVGFELQERGIPRQDYVLTDGQGNAIGRVTSGCMSPCRKIGVGMGYVKPEFAKLGTTIAVQIRNKELIIIIQCAVGHVVKLIRIAQAFVGVSYGFVFSKQQYIFQCFSVFGNRKVAVVFTKEQFT